MCEVKLYEVKNLINEELHLPFNANTKTVKSQYKAGFSEGMASKSMQLSIPAIIFLMLVFQTAFQSKF